MNSFQHLLIAITLIAAAINFEHFDKASDAVDVIVMNRMLETRKVNEEAEARDAKTAKSARMRMEVELRVLSLNCWGIVGISKHREERMTAIANYLSSSDLDFVFLQEIWSQKDYKKIRSKTRNNLPHAHYFHSGVLGSGVCILSKSPIADTGMLKYNLNGYAHKFYHGDWFGGKVVGLCKVNHRGLLINLYVTHVRRGHLSFRSGTFKNIFLEFSVFSMAEPSLYTTLGCVFDSAHCVDMSRKVLLWRAGVSPLSCERFKFNECVCGCPLQDSLCVGATCGHPDNHYTSAYDKHTCPTGKRIDYVMFKVGRGVAASCKVCKNPRLKTYVGTSLVGPRAGGGCHAGDQVIAA
ncbi:hypothetical protein HPB47_026756 [Ixodes persulcatus]|uniref:Uncharacterized protein n=1 Tax=Ixodes persulcatus TaxID=34615 RepID=A0AC60Q077_IXOPE|nr:hypothetical protein HPB47_026756 [Ixodes persulcatus]